MTETLPGAAIPNPTDEAAINAAVDQAITAIDGAATLDELKAVRLAHTGEKSPLSLANREIGRLPKDQKALAGKLMGASRGRVNKALADRAAVLEAENDARILIEETVDVTAAPRRRRASALHAAGPRRGHLRRHGLGDRGRPRGRIRVVQLRRP